MKKIRDKLPILFTVVFFSFISCTEDLKLEAISQISAASFWKTEDDASGGLYAMYTSFRLETINMFLWGEMRSNNFGPSFGGEPTQYLVCYRNTLNASSGNMPTWLGLYTVVHKANLVLKYVPNIDFASEGNKNNILAQAHAMRAYCYFVMVRTWGGIPLVDTPTEGFSEANQRARATVEDIFTFIKEDIDDAVALFPDNNFPSARSLWSKPAVNALKADVYLWTAKRENGGNADFTTALTALNDIETSDVSLLDNFASVFDYTNKGNKEIIFAVRYMENESGESGPYDVSFVYPTFVPPSEELDDSTEVILSGARGNCYLEPQAHVRSQFKRKDQRRNATFKEIYRYIGGYPGGVKTYLTTVQTKYDGVIISGQRWWYDDYVIYRYGDVLLMKAEAKNALGQDPSIEINKVRERAYLTYYSEFVFVNGTKEQNDEAILKEWLLETAFEGHYWWDLLRFGKAFELVPSLQDKVGQDYLLLFPIPQETINIEPKVTQNTGY